VARFPCFHFSRPAKPRITNKRGAAFFFSLFFFLFPPFQFGWLAKGSVLVSDRSIHKAMLMIARHCNKRLLCKILSVPPPFDYIWSTHSFRPPNKCPFGCVFVSRRSHSQYKRLFLRATPVGTYTPKFGGFRQEN
jgi:hypothetical protein